MKTIPVSGTIQPISFYEDDTIDTVRQIIALHVNSHPDRLFIEVKASLPKEYYATNPKHWTDLFLRLSLDGKRITQDRMRIYLTQTRLGTGVTERDITREEWEEHPEDLQALYDPSTDFEEWRILGVDDVHSFVMPLPPRDIALQAASRPIPQTQSLYETLHPYEVTEIRATPVPDAASTNVKINYYPRLKPDTPNTIENLRNSIQSAQTQLKRLLELDTPKHEKVAIVRAKWYIPLVSTEFTAPRTRFEQIFYGMTVNPETPYIGYFTAKTETMRHKFFCPDPKQKKPLLDISMWKGWTNATQPQRRLPTLLLYRGTSRTSFDRIAITDRDITVDVRREKDSKETLEELQTNTLEWMKTFDAFLPFLVQTDIDPSRWELGDMSVVATYAKEIREFDMHRFPCLQTIFGLQNEQFRLLRAEHTSDDITPRELQALQILNQEDAVQTPEYLAEQLNIPIEEAGELLVSVQQRSEELNLEKSLRAYPTIKFSNREVIIKFVSNLERTLQYADILRFVLTSDSESVDSVCPRRMEKVIPKVAIPQQEIQMEGELAADDDFNALLGFVPGDEEAQPEEEVVSEEAVPKQKKMKVQSRATGTYNYFNNRLQQFDPATFDKSIYPGKCDKPKQAVVLTAEDKTRIGPTYDFSNVSDIEKLELADPAGTVICPPYWCMRDEIPLRDDQLVTGDDGELHCPVCDGKVRTADNLDTTEYSVIKRDTAAKYPDYIKALSTINKRKIPCCFQTPRSTSEILAPKEEATYVLDASSASVPGLRFAYLSSELAERLSIKTDYTKTVKKGRIGSGESDIFRVGLGRPSKTLPIILSDKTPILRPRDAKENLLQCSFFRTWKDRKEGETQIDKIISSIDYAYQHGELGLLEELEYVTSFLKCEVIRVDIETGQVVCGFWSESVGASSRTIALLGNTVLAQVSRVKEKKAYKSEFIADLRKSVFKETLPILRDRHTRACAVNVPVLSDAIVELQTKGKTQYEVILDPFNRIQAVFIPKEIILPIQPANVKPDAGVPVRDGYASIAADELPSGDSVRAFLSDTKHAKFKVQAEFQDVDGKVVEIELTSGFRVPIVPEEASEKSQPKEVIDTIRRFDEKTLVDGQPNKEDIRIAQEITYASEIYEFLMFSLSKDIAVDSSGATLDSSYAPLRSAIQTKSANLYKELAKWFKSEAYEDSTKSPVEFVSKVRTPCGQFTDKDKCNKSSLCGWHKNTCKIRVKPVVEKEEVLKRMVKTLRDNDKQRALVLDARLSPFFSTILYLEMPHELITTSV